MMPTVVEQLLGFGLGVFLLVALAACEAPMVPDDRLHQWWLTVVPIAALHMLLGAFVIGCRMAGKSGVQPNWRYGLLLGALATAVTVALANVLVWVLTPKFEQETARQLGGGAIAGAIGLFCLGIRRLFSAFG